MTFQSLVFMAGSGLHQAVQTVQAVQSSYALSKACHATRSPTARGAPWRPPTTASTGEVGLRESGLLLLAEQMSGGEVGGVPAAWVAVEGVGTG